MRLTTLVPLICLTLLACREKDSNQETGLTDDADGDGFAAPADCDDEDPAVNPEATELPYDGVDNDCDESTLDDDLDGDGYPQAEDCDDDNAAVSPDAIEACNGLDDDCDGEIDNAVGDIWYADADGDGFGDPAVSTQDCEGEGLVADNTDCDDADPAVNPAAVELCNGLDDDCDTQVDEPDAADAAIWYADADADGYGDPASSSTACEDPGGVSDNSEDCDDGDAGVNPAAVELCDGVDNDCDGAIDPDSSSDAATWYADADADGYGDASSSRLSCSQPSGTVADATDCDDSDASAWPGATEVCDLDDEDCDGSVDEGVTLTWYADADADGYGDASVSTAACTAPSGTVADSSDCDDGDSSAFPGATEVCDLDDEDCDGSVDEGVTPTWYADADADGYGDASVSTASCTAPNGTVADSTDCDDGDASTYPNATPGCDGGDYDCDGLVDNDADGDTYADSACGGDDCDDSDATVIPEANGTCAEGIDCLNLLAAGNTSSGTYSIDPDGYGVGLDPFDVSCDMTTDSGGWTLALHLYDMASLSEDDFLTLFSHNRFTDETWSYSGGAIASGLSGSGLVSLSGQGAIAASVMDGLWDDVRMTCSQTSGDATESSYAQVDSYATTNGVWDLLGGASNGVSYSVSSALQSTGQSTIWHDNEIDTHNSGHYLCDYTNSTYTSQGGAPQFGFCYTDFLNNPNSSDYGDSIVSLAFGTYEGADGWSAGFTMECGAMGTTALQNTGTVSIWLR